MLPLFALAGFVGDTISSSPDKAASVLDVILQHGITGAMLLLVLWGYARKDKALEEERNARIEDAKERAEDAERYGQIMVTVKGEVSVQANKLIEVATNLERREREREERQREREREQQHDRQRFEESRRTGPQRPIRGRDDG